MRRLAKFGATEEAFRKGLKDHLALDEDAGLQTHVTVGDACSAWQDAVKQVAKEVEMRAEARASERPATTTKTRFALNAGSFRSAARGCRRPTHSMSVPCGKQT